MRRANGAGTPSRHGPAHKINNFVNFGVSPTDVLELRSARVSPRAACRALAIVALALLGVVGCRGGGTDYLIRRQSFEALLRYFRELAASGRRWESFRTAFGRSLSDFECEVLEPLGQVLR